MLIYPNISCLISKIGEKSESPYLDKILTTWGAHFSTKTFAIDSFDIPEEELFLTHVTYTVVTQFEKP
jgi:hypothetical protein